MKGPNRLYDDSGSYTQRIMLRDLPENRTNKAVTHRRSSEQIDTAISEQEAETFIEDESDPKNDIGRSSNSNLNVAEEFDDESDLDEEEEEGLDDEEGNESDEDDRQVHQQIDASHDELDEDLHFSHCIGRPTAFLNSKFVRNLLDLENQPSPSLASPTSTALTHQTGMTPRGPVPCQPPRTTRNRKSVVRMAAVKGVASRSEAIDRGVYVSAARCATPSSTSSNSIPGKNKKKKRAPRERSPPKISAPRSTAREVVIACFPSLCPAPLTKKKNKSTSSSGMKHF